MLPSQTKKIMTNAIPFGFDLNQTVPYTSANVYFVFTELFLSIIAWFGTIAILVILLQSTYNTRFILSLTVADFVFSTTLIIFHTKHLTSGGWSSGPIGCIISSGLSMTIVSGSVLSMVAISVERYLSIFHAIAFTQFQLGLMVALIWIVPLILGPLIWLTSMDNVGDYVMLQNGKSICMANFGSSSTTGKFIAYAYLVSLFASITWVVYAYVTIYCYYKKANRRKNPKINIKKAKLERELLIKCMSLSILFLICWIPFLIFIVYMVVMGEQPPEAFTSLCATNSVLNSALNPLLLLVFDSRIRTEVIEVFINPLAKASVSTYGSKAASVNDKEKHEDVKVLSDRVMCKDPSDDKIVQESDKNKELKKEMCDDAISGYLRDLVANTETKKVPRN